MNPSATPQILGNLSAGLAALTLVLPLRKLLTEYAGKHVNDDQWVAQALQALVPLWIALTVAIVCVVSTGGFDTLGLGRPLLHVFAVGATAALGVLTFVFVGLYVRPGFTPRSLYSPGIILVPLSTLLLAVLSLNPGLGSAVPIQWLRLLWTVVAGLSLVACLVVSGTWMFRTGLGGLTRFAHLLRNPAPSPREIVARIAALDPDSDFRELLYRSLPCHERPVRDAANQRLRSHPDFLNRLAAELDSGNGEVAMEYLASTDLPPAGQSRLARPAYRAMRRWVHDIPAHNYTTRENLRRLRRQGEKILKVLPARFADTDVDFTPVLQEFQDKVTPGN